MAVETGRQYAGGHRLDRDGDISVAEVKGRRGHLPPVGRFQLRGKRFAAGRRAGRRRRDDGEPLPTAGVVPG